MPLILRIDVDKPYGNHTISRKVASKFFEETALPCLSYGYLDHLKDFLNLLNQYKVPAICYFRLCTLPGSDLIKEMLNYGHQIGWHLENSIDYESFSKELEEFNSRLGITPHSFSKHGSGLRKLGRYHYPSYEPDKYLEWSRKSGIPFYFGNELLQSNSNQKPTYFPEIFWIEANYRHENFPTVESVLEKSRQEIVPILTHPENVVRDLKCKNDLLKLIQLAHASKVPWMLL